MRSVRAIRIAVTASAGILLIVHLVWPRIRVDAITLGLTIIGVLPWLVDLLKSAKFPGGWEITFRDVEEAGAKVADGGNKSSLPRDDGRAVRGIGANREEGNGQERLLVQGDANLALVGLRIEIERRLQAIALRRNLPESRGLNNLIRKLRSQGVLRDEVVWGLNDLVAAGNKAAHGAFVDPRVAEWASYAGPSILAALDELGDIDGSG